MGEQSAEKAYIEEAIQMLTRVERESAINCTGPGEVGCKGRKGWHSWSEHRLHVAAAQVAALCDAGLLSTPPATPNAEEESRG